MGKHEAVRLQLVRTPSGRDNPLSERLNSRILQTIRDVAADEEDDDTEDCETAIFGHEEKRVAHSKK